MNFVKIKNKLLKQDNALAQEYLKQTIQGDDTELICKALSDVAVALGLSKADIARLANITPTAVNKIFNGGNPTLENFLSILDALGYGLSLRKTTRNRRVKTSRMTNNSSVSPKKQRTSA